MKNKIIHWLGGYTKKDLDKIKCMVNVDVKKCNIWAAKLEAAHLIGERLLEENELEFVYDFAELTATYRGLSPVNYRKEHQKWT